MNNPYFRIFITMLVMLALSILPLPVFLNEIRPPWVLLFVLYMQYFFGRSFHIFYIVGMGLALDVLLMTALGQHALTLTIIAWMTNRNTRYFRLYSMGQQMAWVGFFCLIYQIMNAIIDVFLGNSMTLSLWRIAGGTMTGLLFWPWVRWIAKDALNEN